MKKLIFDASKFHGNDKSGLIKEVRYKRKWISNEEYLKIRNEKKK